MSQHQILLSDEIYTHLLVVAQAVGLSPTEWIAVNLTKTEPAQAHKNSLQDISDLIGSIDSTEHPTQTYQQTPFSEILANKFPPQDIQQT
jgi:hypothetical protein